MANNFLTPHRTQVGRQFSSSELPPIDFQEYKNEAYVQDESPETNIEAIVDSFQKILGDLRDLVLTKRVADEDGKGEVVVDVEKQKNKDKEEEESEEEGKKEENHKHLQNGKQSDEVESSGNESMEETTVSAVLDSHKQQHPGNLYHRVDAERFRKLVQWVDYNPNFLSLLHAAWKHSSFWPFLETDQSVRLIERKPEYIVVRLSNTHPGTITVTRIGKVMHGKGDNRRYCSQVKHKRYFVVGNNKILITGVDPQRHVSWDGLLTYLHQNECCICLEELKEHVYQLNCGHHFHQHCFETFLRYNVGKKQRKDKKCPLCRQQISSLKTMHEQKPMPYGHVDFSDMN